MVGVSGAAVSVIDGESFAALFDAVCAEGEARLELGFGETVGESFREEDFHRVVVIHEIAVVLGKGDVDPLQWAGGVYCPHELGVVAGRRILSEIA